jgi:hypothetical protein
MKYLTQLKQLIESLFCLLFVVSCLSPIAKAGNGLDSSLDPKEFVGKDYFYYTEFNTSTPLHVMLHNSKNIINAIELRNISDTVIDLSNVKVAIRYQTGLVEEIVGAISNKFIPPDSSVILLCNYDIYDWGPFARKDPFLRKYSKDPVIEFDILIIATACRVIQEPVGLVCGGPPTYVAPSCVLRVLLACPAGVLSVS